MAEAAITLAPENRLTPIPVRDTKQYINAMIWGDYGVGKTTLIATAQQHPAMKNVLILNKEGGLLSVVNQPGVESVAVRSVEDLEAVFWCLIKREKGYGHFQTVAIDSGTEIQTQDLEDIASSSFNDAKKRGKRESVDEVFQEDYGKDTTKLKRVFRMFRDAPFHFIVTALRKDIMKKGLARDAEPELVRAEPAFTTKLGNAIGGYMDFVWYLDVKEEEKKDDKGTVVGIDRVRMLLTQQRGPFRAKTRGEKFPLALGDVVRNPNLAKIYDLMLQSEGLQPDPKKVGAVKV